MTAASVTKRALEKALEKPAPDSIPMSGIRRLRQRDYYVVFLDLKDERNRFLVRKVQNNGVEGLWFPEDVREGIPACIPWPCVKEYVFSAKHYFRDAEVRYTRPTLLLIVPNRLVGSAAILYRRLRAFILSQRTLVRQDRIAVLRKLVDEKIEKDKAQFSPVSVMDLMHGRLWMYNPRFSELQRHYDLLLHSLTESGDLIKEQNSFKLHPRALKTIAEFEEEEQRHRENVRQQALLSLLTALLIFVSFLQLLWRG